MHWLYTNDEHGHIAVVFNPFDTDTYARRDDFWTLINGYVTLIMMTVFDVKLTKLFQFRARTGW